MAPGRSPSRRETLGAALVSSLGTFPLHLMPFVVATVISSGKLPVHLAGVLTSVYWIGILSTTLLLPLVAGRVSVPAAATCAFMLPGVAMASTLASGHTLLAAWFALGAACGVLNFTGTTFAATTAHPHRVFALRLGCVLVAAATGLMVATFGLGTTTYRDTATTIALVSVAVGGLGMVLYRAPQSLRTQATPAESARNTAVAWRLALVVLFFVGQPGFLAYAAHVAIERGLEPERLYLAFGLSKLAGVVALYFTRAGSTVTNLGLLSSTVALGIALISQAGTLWAFGLGLLFWELAINPLSARLQGAVVEHSPTIAGRWLPAALGIGACLGPAFHGAALHAGVGAFFLAFSLASAFLPLVLVAAQRRAATTTP